MARVTVITPYFWPEVTASVPLMTNLCEDLVLSGHEVKVITSFPYRNIDDEARTAFMRNRQLPEMYKGAHVIRYPNPCAARKGVVAKILEGAMFTLWATFAALRFYVRTDVFFVYSNPPLLALPVSFSAYLRRVPIVYNLQDLFPDSAVADGVLRSSSLVSLLKVLEKMTYRRSTVISVICPSFEKHVRRICPNSNVVVLPNWIDTDQIDYVPPEKNTVLKESGLSGKFIVLYAGNIGFAQNLEVVINAASLLQHENGIAFAIVGDGQYKESMQNRANRLGLKNVFFLSMQPQEKVPEVYSMGDVCLVTVRKGREYSSMPSKTWTIMACRRPVVACMGSDSDTGRVLLEEKIGLVVPPDNPEQLASSIIRLRDDKELRESLGFKGRQYVERELSRRLITSRYARLVHELVSRR